MSAPKRLYHRLLSRSPAPLALRLHGLWKLGYLPNLSRPRRFNERIQARKLRWGGDPRMIALADKVLVKDHVAAAVGAEHVIPTLWAGKRLPPREQRNWPLPFVIKANHGSGWNRFVRTAGDLDWPAIESEAADWLARDWPPHLHEGWYNRIERRLLVEPAIDGGLLDDHKFFVFGGRIGLIQVDTGRFARHRRAFYDPEWRLQPFGLGYERETRGLPPPRHLDRMIAIAERLGENFDFVRVDLYDRPEGPLFGEMTFAPGAGFERFDPACYDRVVGDLWPDALSVCRSCR